MGLFLGFVPHTAKWEHKDGALQRVAYQRLLRELLRAQRRTLLELRNEGVIGGESMHHVERDLDREESVAPGSLR